MIQQLALIDLPAHGEDTDSWCTPREVLDVVDLFWPDGPDLDPCSNPASLVGAREEIMPPRDGLAEDWVGRVWCNPPYSKPGPWLGRCAHHDGQALALVKLDPTTSWWNSWVRGGRPVCLWPRRLRFCGAQNYAAPFPSVIVYYGHEFARFHDIWRRHGTVTVV